MSTRVNEIQAPVWNEPIIMEMGYPAVEVQCSLTPKTASKHGLAQRST